MSPFFGPSITYVDNVTTAFIGQNVAAFANSVKPFAFSMLGLAILIWGFCMLRGMIQEPIMDMVSRVIKWSIIFGFAFNMAIYNTYIIDIVTLGPEQITQSFGHAPTSSMTVNKLDLILNQGFAAGAKFWGKAGVLKGDFGMYIIAVATWTMTLAVTTYAFALIVLSKLAITAIICLGPLFIISLLFTATADFFNKWVQQLVNYFLVPVLVIIVNLMVLEIFARAATGAAAVTSSGKVDEVFPFLAAGIMSLCVLASVLNIASGLAGGMALSSFGIGAAAAKFFGRGAKKGGKAALKGGAKLAVKGSRAAWSGYKSTRSNSISKSKR